MTILAANNNEKRTSSKSERTSVVANIKKLAEEAKNKTFLSRKSSSDLRNTLKTTPASCDSNSSTGSLIDEAIDIIAESENKNNRRRASLVRRGSSVTHQAEHEMLLDNQNRLSMMLQNNCNLHDLGTSSDESDLEDDD